MPQNPLGRRHLPTPSPQRETRPRWTSTTRSAAIALGVLIPVGVLAAPGAAMAAEQPDAITAVRVRDTELEPGQPFRLEFDWAVPDVTPAGDTFSLALPAELQNADTTAIRLTDPATGALVALGAWSGRTAVFTLTDYVTEHPFGIHGSGWFTAQLDQTTTGGGTTTVTTTVAGTVLTFHQTPHDPGDPANHHDTKPAQKWGLWSRSDHGTANPHDAITWVLSLPVFDHDVSDVVLVDAAPAGAPWEFSCDDQTLRYWHGYPDPKWADSFPLTAPDAGNGEYHATLDCSAGRATVTIDSIAAHDYVEVLLMANVTDRIANSFGNEYSVTAEQVTTGSSWTLELGAGGTGVGGPAAHLDLQKVVAGAVPSDAPSTYRVIATCTAPGATSANVFTRDLDANGAAADITPLQPGTVCEVSEPDPHGARVSMSAEQVTLTAGTTSIITITNTFAAQGTGRATPQPPMVLAASGADAASPADAAVMLLLGGAAALIIGLRSRRRRAG